MLIITAALLIHGYNLKTDTLKLSSKMLALCMVQTIAISETVIMCMLVSSGNAGKIDCKSIFHQKNTIYSLFWALLVPFIRFVVDALQCG